MLLTLVNLGAQEDGGSRLAPEKKDETLIEK
jgi:hypothetical protein